MVAMGEKEVIQTALMSVGCYDQLYETRAQFDTGSTRTYVIKELVKVLKALLTGNDYYKGIILDERKKIQDNLYVVNSKLG